MTKALDTFKVTDRQSFITFLRLLSNEFLTTGDNWENKTLDNYLDALGQYAQDIQGYYNNKGENIDADNPRWETFADILRGAIVYE